MLLEPDIGNENIKSKNHSKDQQQEEEEEGKQNRIWIYI